MASAGNARAERPPPRPIFPARCGQERSNSMSVYKVIEVVGTSPVSWEEAARVAIETAGASLRDLRVAEITKLDIRLDDDEIIEYRARVMISFKYDNLPE